MSADGRNDARLRERTGPASGRDARMVCADVGGSFIDIALVSRAGEIGVREKHVTPTADWEAFASVFTDFLDRHRQDEPGDTPIAVATAGLVDPRTRIVTSANVASINGRALQDELERILEERVAVINDADAFVLAEATLGMARGHQRVFGVVLGTGVGGGLFADGRIVTGVGGVGGEWGHGQVVPRSPVASGALPVFRCGCGAWGCLDTVGGARGMERLHRFLHGSDATSREIVDGWVGGARHFAETVDLYCDLLAGPLTMLLNAFPASIVPVSGGLSSSTELIAELDRRVRGQMLLSRPHALLRQTTLSSDAGILGAFVFGHSHEERVR